jgi:hypothetical protein
MFLKKSGYVRMRKGVSLHIHYFMSLAVDSNHTTMTGRWLRYHMSSELTMTSASKE